MKRLRSVAMVSVAMLAASLVVASAASAFPEFKPSTTQTILGSGGVGELETATGTKIECKKNTSQGRITSVDEATGVVVKYSECEATEGSKKCKVNSETPKGAAGEIITDTVKGSLGEVAKAESATEVGILFKPETGTTFVSIEKGSCGTLGAPVNGSVAAEVTPVNMTQLTGLLVFVGSKGTQTIKTIKILSGSEKPALKAFGLVSSSLNSTEVLTFEKEIFVT